MAAVSVLGIPGVVRPGGLLPPYEDFGGTRPGRLGDSIGVSDGGEITGKPGNGGDEEVVTDAVLVAVVVAEVGSVIGARNTPSEPLTELGGLVVRVELSSEARAERREKDRFLSLSGLVSGGGILMLARSMLAIEWVDCRCPAFRFGESALLAAASRV